MTTTDIPENAFKITAGPSVGEVWDSAKYAYAKTKLPVTFTGTRIVGRVKREMRLIVNITGVTHDDGSGHSFVVRGYHVTAGTKLFDGAIQFYYNAQTRQGYINLARAK